MIEGAKLEIASETKQPMLAMLPEEGILGSSFLASVVVEVNWETNRVRFHDPTSYEAPAGATSLPLEFRITPWDQS